MFEKLVPTKTGTRQRGKESSIRAFMRLDGRALERVVSKRSVDFGTFVWLWIITKEADTEQQIRRGNSIISLGH